MYVKAKTHEIAAWTYFYTINNEPRKLDFYCDGKQDLCLYDTKIKGEIPLDIKKMHITKRQELLDISKELCIELPLEEIRKMANECVRKYYDDLIEENIRL